MIPPAIDIQTRNVLGSGEKRRVAAYARVSTDKTEQHESYEAQVNYYTHYIAERSDWTFVDMYADEGLSGTNTRKREGFKRMMADALAGKMDLIVTKSVSRFARNTVDSLNAVRSLKEKGVEIWFEKENIRTLNSEGELLITIMSSLAQEESGSLSLNVTWGHRRRFEEGKVSVQYSRFLGLEKGEDGRPKVVESEAKIVRLIFDLYLQGRSIHWIANHLTQCGHIAPGGKILWHVNTVRSILQNEKYKGEAILQKTYGTDFLTKARKKNEGEVTRQSIFYNFIFLYYLL